MGRNEYDIPGHFHIFTFLEAVNGVFKVQFLQGFIFAP